MDSKDEREKHMTPSKDLHSLIIKESVQAKIAHGNLHCDSPFKWLPHVSTPPSRFFKIKNPFEAHLTERLHTSVFSPSVFSKEISPNRIEKFKWTIEDISSLNPADIDESSVGKFHYEVDPLLEQTAQSRIERYFSKKEIVPSPMDNNVKTEPLISEDASPPAVEETKHYVNEECQTVLTLPPILPAALEAVLRPYFSYTVDQQSSTPNTALYKQLFEYDDHESNHSSSHSIQSSPAPSCAMSPIQFSPYDINRSKMTNRCESLEHLPPLRECDLSPIASTETSPVQKAESPYLCRFNNNYSRHMSVDNSMNIVPDGGEDLPPNQSLAFESAHSFFNNEVLSNSTVNWDMEYKHVSLVSVSSSPESNCNEMDVSNCNTPRSKIFTSQRKKLSDSFILTELSNENDENKENVFYDVADDEEIAYIRNAKSVITKTLSHNRDLTDAGYCTGVHTISEESSWGSSAIFVASTPTKNKVESN